MSYIEKEKLIKADIASIENRVRHAFNQGYDLGFKDGREKAKPQESSLDKIRAEILDCLKALDEIEKSGFNIYLPNEMSGRRLTYKQCLGFIDKYKAESENT
jgi:hypothetical protein